MNPTNTFQVGTTYSARSACDSDCIFTFEVVARTAKFITVREYDKTYRVGVITDDQGEWAKPHGTYSMCTVIRATRPN